MTPTCDCNYPPNNLPWCVICGAEKEFNVNPKPGEILKIAYLAGAISSRMDTYKKVFDEADARWAAKGYAVINPAARDLSVGGVHPPWEDYMRLCLSDVCSADLVVFLHGWETSMGARLEFLVATTLKIEIIFEKE